MGFREGLRAVIREQQEVWRAHQERRDPTVQAMRAVEHRHAAAQTRAEALEGTAYDELVDKHLRDALNDYVLRSIEYQHSVERISLSFTSAELNRASQANRAAGEAGLDAMSWLSAVLGAVRRAAFQLGDEGVEAFNSRRLAEYPDGSYILTLASVEGDPDMPFTGGDDFIAGTAICEFGLAPDAADELALKIANVGPQEVIANISLDLAVSFKEHLELLGLDVRIKEGRRPTIVPGGRREPIPESVRHEVWRRDGGQCVDCGSRERLEFDHIIPLSQGGSNTARNLELRCEACNRRKGARI